MLRTSRVAAQHRVQDKRSFAHIKTAIKRCWNQQHSYARRIRGGLEHERKVLREEEEEHGARTLTFGKETTKGKPQAYVSPLTRWEKFRFWAKYIVYKRRPIDDIIEHVEMILKHQLYPSFTYLMHLINFAVAIPPFFFLYYNYFSLTGWLVHIGVVSQEKYNAIFEHVHWGIVLVAHMIAWGVWYDLSGLFRYRCYANYLGPFYVRRGWCYQTANIARNIAASQPKAKSITDLNRASLKNASGMGPKRKAAAEDAEAKASSWRRKKK